MNDQAVENWLFRIMRDSRTTHPDYHWTFYCTHPVAGRLDDSLRHLGADVILSPVPIGRKREFVSAMRRTINAGGYDIMHAHHDIVSALYLLAGTGTCLKRRIVHVHNTSMSLPTPSGIKQKIAWEPMRRTCLALSDRIVGISKAALASMILGPPVTPRDVVVYYGIDTSKFKKPKREREAILEDIGVPCDARVILFAGRMTEYKNPRFVLDVLSEVLLDCPNAIAVFAGIGPETETVATLATARGLKDHIRMVGFRDDLPELMLASDVLLWPGQEVPMEGLGLGIVEAQAAGLPLVMSLSVPDDAIVIAEMVSVVPLARGKVEWAKATVAKLTEPQIDRAEALRRVEASPFSLSAGTANVMALYQNIPSVVN
ncbi:MAG: glycosyltransferase [Burkholderiales bacterium]